MLLRAEAELIARGTCARRRLEPRLTVPKGMDCAGDITYSVSATYDSGWELPTGIRQGFSCDR